MNTPWKWATRVVLEHFGLWPWVELARLGARFILKRPNEEDFRFFSHLDGQDGLFVDVGANIGQSAISLRMFNRSLAILSIEPNPALARHLRAVGLLLRRFQFRTVGIGASAQTRPLFYPVVQGVMLAQEASFSREILTEDPMTSVRVRQATGQTEFSIQESQMQIVTLDSLALTPTIIKLDVQGYELAALEGARETLARARPILMIENGDALGAIDKFLKAHGFCGPYSRTADNRLGPVSTTDPSLNVFFLPCPSGHCQKFVTLHAKPRVVN